ncbi:MAG: hypothetical protein WCJ57_04910 [Candidatus Falkowbacteria bacterium]
MINPSEDEMTGLIKHSQINILVTFQATGLKLKLLKALFNGRFCLVNPEMVTGTSLTDLCVLASTPQDFKEKIIRLFTMEFNGLDIQDREKTLNEFHSNQKNCKLLLEILTLSE